MTENPGNEPSGKMNGIPSGSPSGEPSGYPSGEPSGYPSGEPSGSPSGNGRKPAPPSRDWIVALVCIAAIGVGVFLLYGALTKGFGSYTGTPAESTAASSSSGGILPDPTMGYNKVDFTNAVLGAASKKELLVVYEQEVAAETEVSDAFLNWDIFKKTKKIHSYGTGAYTVDMTHIASDAIDVDTDRHTVTVTIPKTTLQYLEIDDNKTTFEDTEHAIFGFGDIQMTEEQQKEVDTQVRHSMLDALLQDDLFSKADQAGLGQVRQMLQPAVAAVSDNFVVKCILSDSAREASKAAVTDSIPDDGDISASSAGEETSS